MTEGGALVSARLQFFVRCAAGPGDEAERAEGQQADSGRELSGGHMARVRDRRHRIA